MPWSGGTYTKGNNATGGWAGDESNGIGIESGRHDTQDNDFATGINSCLNKDGSNSCTGDLNLGGNKPVNVAAGTAAAPAICVGNDTNTGIYSPAADTWAVSTNGSEKVRVTSTGNVGLGTTTPAYPLTIQGSASSAVSLESRGRSADDTSVILFTENDGVTQLGRVQFSTTELSIQKTGNNPINLNTSNQNRLTVTGSGNVGIGTTTPSYQLELSTDSAAKPTTNTWTIVSDERIKTNIAPYSKGLTEICQVEPVTYEYNGKAGLPEGDAGISIIAQQLQSVFPECIGTFKAKLNEEDEEETELLNYNGHAITFALINAIKELCSKVESLEARIVELEGSGT